MTHSYLEYLRLKAIISTLRFFDFEGWTAASPRPDDSYTFTSRDGKREVKVNVCKYMASEIGFRPNTLR
jgi:hypothetical protein